MSLPGVAVLGERGLGSVSSRDLGMLWKGGAGLRSRTRLIKIIMPSCMKRI
jgi:hypothetical protein